MIEPAQAYEHSFDIFDGRPPVAVWVEIVPDTDGSADPQDNDNAGTIYSWVYDRTWEGDEHISEPDLEIDCPECDGEGELPNRTYLDQTYTCPRCEGNRTVPCDLPTYMRRNYDAVLTIPLFFADYGSSGARLYVSDDPNCCICFTQKKMDEEWRGSVDDATKYAEARVSELDMWFQGYVFGIVIRDREGGEVMESVWGYIGEPDDEYIKSEASDMAESCAREIDRERQLAQEWAARGVMTITN